MYHYDPSTMPTGTFSSHYGLVGETIDQQLENINMSLEQQLILHQNSDGSFDSSLPSVMSVPPSPLAYWPSEQQPIPHHLIPAGFCPPPSHHHIQQQQCPNPPVMNGEMAPMTVFFTPPFPYQLNN